MAQLKSTWKEKISIALGFNLTDLSFESITRLLHEPRDSASLAIWRVVFGLLIIIDIPQERGMASISRRWGDPQQCHFPLFYFLSPLPVDWMYVIYLLMFLGALGLTIGFLYRLSCLTFVLTYWYIFLLDKSVWNNHSYLYGLIGLQFLFIDANCCWSVDGLLKHSIRNSHVPLWNYALVRFQIFIVYFVAGLKKLDKDWVSGYSMGNLADNWIFDPFRLLLTNEQIDLYVVHLGGLLLDLFIGFFLYFDKTRLFAAFFCASFHTMNSQMFQIGMFPYVMLATIPLFCYADWPRRVFKHFPDAFKIALPLDTQLQTNKHCLYQQPINSLDLCQQPVNEIRPLKGKLKGKSTRRSQRGASNAKRKVATENEICVRHKVVIVCLLAYSVTQVLLPYSHFVTKGYNNWTDGLYGYSWDMMVHSWSSQHIKITYVDNTTGQVGYITPGVHLWDGASERWSAHGDMLKQYAMCLVNRLKDHNIRHPQLYFDVWRSLNGRFQQRMWNPKVDIVAADWSPLSQSSYLMPLLSELSPWRTKFDEIQDALDNQTTVVFVADFPGLYLENFVDPNLGNTSIQVLKGTVAVEIADGGKNVTLQEGDSIQVPPGRFHIVRTISDTPSCYMYLTVNTTDVAIRKKFNSYKEIRNHNRSNLSEFSSEELKIFNDLLEDEKFIEEYKSMTVLDRFQDFYARKWSLFSSSFNSAFQAVYNIAASTTLYV
ncbi:vitamin K-dependent gamma-carboxylase-like [Anneissia japonica]|uniref:vitamin K-dependent gamma-carboxylase-like n=1 Tax=Anneissia japonica TaxID=1529436 RepID=UPI0014256BB5|nr:vitamin K-dependent gamma-carboxylase-like [Anneissia japonica]